MQQPQPSSWEEQVDQQLANLRAMLIGLAVIAAIGIGLAGWGFAKSHSASDGLHRDEQVACQLLQRGVSAGHHLSAAFQDINKLLDRASPADIAAERKADPVALTLLLSLRENTGAYVQIESQQPQSISCGF